jgi:integrase
MNATSTTKPKPGVYDAVKFVHRGRQRQIFRRFPQGNFTIRREVDGKAIWKTLDTPIAKIAIANARAWLDAVTQSAADEKWSRLDPLRSRTPWASIGDILERYEARATGAVQIDKHSVKSNANCLRQLLRIVTGTTDPDQLRADVLTEATARTFIEKCRTAERSESGIRSSLVQARSVFSPALLYIYDGLKIPDLAGFRVAVRFDTGEDTGFDPIPAATIERMESAAQSLREVDAATWIVYMLMSRLGMRNVEIERATIDWLRADESGTWHLAIPETKGGLARFLRLPDDLTAATLRTLAGEGNHLIPARTVTERRIICQRTINRFVSQFLPDRPKCAYELRKWAGSLVWSTQGAEAAQHFLGHRSMSTTERYYARFLRPVRAISAADRASIYGPEKAA